MFAIANRTDDLELGFVKPTIIWCLLSPWRVLSTAILLYRIFIWTGYKFHILWITALPIFLYYIYRVILLRSIRYTFFEDFMTYSRGLFSIEKDYLEYYRIKDLSLFKSFGMRIINVERLTIISSDRRFPRLVLGGIEQSFLIDWLRNLVERKRLESGVFEVDSV